MEWKFRKDFVALPGVKLKYGAGGISTNIHNFNTEQANQFKVQKLAFKFSFDSNGREEIKSAAIDELTPPELQDLKMLLSAANKSFLETGALLKEKTTQAKKITKSIKGLENTIFSFLFRKKIIRKKEESASINAEIQELTDQLHFSVVRIEIDTEKIYQEKYNDLRQAFNLLKDVNKIWDLTTSKKNNMIQERTSAANTVTRSEVLISEKQLQILESTNPALCIHNMNGGDIYLYPGFLIIYESDDNFAVLNYVDIIATFSNTRFIESEKVPPDSKIIDHTWLKVNKDGTRDKRFSGNYQIPVVQYAEIHFTSATGLNERFCFSNPERAHLFHRALNNYIEVLTKKNPLE